MFGLFRRIWQGLLAVWYLFSSRNLFAPHIKRNPANAAFINKACGDSFPSLIWNLFAGAFESEEGIEEKHVMPLAGSLNEGDTIPGYSKLIPITLALDDEDKKEEEEESKKKKKKDITPITLGEVTSKFSGMPIVLNFGSIT